MILIWKLNSKDLSFFNVRFNKRLKNRINYQSFAWFAVAQVLRLRDLDNTNKYFEVDIWKEKIDAFSSNFVRDFRVHQSDFF